MDAHLREIGGRKAGARSPRICVHRYPAKIMAEARFPQSMRARAERFARRVVDFVHDKAKPRGNSCDECRPL